MTAEVLEEKLYPCEAVSLEELETAVRESDWRGISGILREGTHQILSDEIPWSRLNSLCIWGDTNASFNNAIDHSGFSPGSWVSQDGRFLLLVHPETDAISSLLSRCSRSLNQLVVKHSAVTSLSALENLSSLIKLNLFWCDELTALPGLTKLSGLTYLDLSWCTKLTTLPGLESLSNLTYLDLSNCWSLTAPPGLKSLSELTYLKLTACRNFNALPGLENLSGLKELNLSGFYQLTNLLGLDNLRGLKKLILSDCENLTALPDLKNLSRLTHLILSNCENLTALPGLKNLSCLKELNLFGCRSLTALPGLENLSALKSLNLYGCSNLTALPGLKSLSSLTSLDLSMCEKLNSLSGLESLSGMTYLNLSACHSLTALPKLEQLTRLKELNLSMCNMLTAMPKLENLSELKALVLYGCEKLTALPGLENLSNLTYLHLYKCRSLSALPGLEKLAHLEVLDISGCHSLTEVPNGIRQCKSLRRLQLRDLCLTSLPDWLPEITERFITHSHKNIIGTTGAVVNLADTTVDGVDMSIFDQPHEMILKWFEEYKAGRTQSLNEMKVIFLGDGEAGKSYTISRLMNNGGDPLDYEGVRTPGIAIKHHPCKFSDRDFKVNYWDFGGQEIMHAMHRIFLTNRTMYVVLVSVKDDDYQARAEYWLRNIKSFAPDAPVLLAFNKIDIRPCLFLDKAALRTANGNLKQIVSMSALEFDQEKFDSEFRSVLLQEIINTGMLDVAWPKSWIELKSRMETIQSPHIPFREYTKICKECRVEDVQIELLHWFNDLGVSFCFRDNFKLKNQIILQPKWITNGLYIILFNKCRDVASGMVPHKSIHELLENAPNDTTIQCTDRSAEYEIPRDAEYVLGIMRQFGLSLQIGEDREFIPMLCQPHPSLDLARYEVDEKVLEFHMDFEYLPNNVLHRLMVEQYSELDIENVWRAGARFQQPGTGLSAVVSIDKNTLKFFISRSDSRHAPQTYLTALKGHVTQIWQQMGLQPPKEKLVYKRDGKLGIFDYEELRQNFKNGIRNVYSSIWQQNVSIADILDLLSSNFATAGFEPHHAPVPRSTDPLELLNAIRRSCRTIQDEPIYRLIPGGNSSDMEDLRNRRVRDDLGKEGYNVADQSQRGSGKTGRGVGEVDLMVWDSNHEPWTIIEALRVSNGTKGTWNNHLDKLIGKYNTRGYPVLYLLTYVDATPQDFGKIWKGYQSHLKKYSPDQFIHCQCIFDDEKNSTNPQYIKVAKCQYKCGGYTPTVCHIFVRIPTPGE